MRTQIAIAALMLVPALAMAQAAPAQLEPVKVGGTVAKIVLPGKAYKLQASEFKSLAGQYELADGKTLTMSGTAKHMFAQIDGMPRAELVAASPETLVAKNKQMRIEFGTTANGIVSEVVVTYVAPTETKGRRKAS